MRRTIGLRRIAATVAVLAGLSTIVVGTAASAAAARIPSPPQEPTAQRI